MAFHALTDYFTATPVPVIALTEMIGTGVAQGSILCPILFNFYINDIIKSLKLHSFLCTLMIHVSCQNSTT